MMKPSEQPQQMMDTPTVSIYDLSNLFWLTAARGGGLDAIFRGLADVYGARVALLERGRQGRAYVPLVYPEHPPIDLAKLMWDPLFQKALDDPVRGCLELEQRHVPEPLRALGVRNYAVVADPYSGSRVVMFFNTRKDQPFNRVDYNLTRLLLTALWAVTTRMKEDGTWLDNFLRQTRDRARLRLSNAAHRLENLEEVLVMPSRTRSENGEALLQAFYGPGWRQGIDSNEELQAPEGEDERVLVARLLLAMDEIALAERLLGIPEEQKSDS